MNLQESFDDLVESLAKQIADKAIETIAERDANIWYNQKELKEIKGFSWQYIKQMESYGLPSRKQGKDKMYCLADINEVLHLMKN